MGVREKICHAKYTWRWIKPSVISVGQHATIVRLGEVISIVGDDTRLLRGTLVGNVH